MLSSPTCSDTAVVSTCPRHNSHAALEHCPATPEQGLCSWLQEMSSSLSTCPCSRITSPQEDKLKWEECGKHHSRGAPVKPVR